MEYEKLKCRICFSDTLLLFLKVNNYNLYRCVNCKTAALYPLPDGKDIDNSNEQKYNTASEEKAYLAVKSKLTQRAVSDTSIIKKFKTGGKLLDVGCSYGFYLNQFRKSGFTVYGLEIATRAIKYARNKLKLTILKGDIMSFEFSQTYDVITLYEVIEHLPQPSEIIKKLNNLLNRQGLLIIQTPNIDSFMFKLARKKWFWLLTPQHLHLFTITSLKFLLNKNGFKILLAKTWDDYDEFVKNILYILHLKDKGKTRFFYDICYKLLLLFKPLSGIWSRLGFGGEITIFAQKIT